MSLDRDPCPYRIVDDAGGAFGFGLVGGSIWHFVGGIRNAPKGKAMSQAFARMRARAPILGGSFAVWGTLFSVCDCSFAAIRRKEDQWNAIASGAATGGILAARAGLKAAGKNALIGGVILAAIEGLGVMIQRVLVPLIQKQQEEQTGAPVRVDKLEPPNDPLRASFASHTPLHATPSTGSGLVWDTSSNSSTSSGSTSGSSSGTAPSSGSGGGFDLDSIQQFDSQGDSWKPSSSLEDDASSKPSDTKPWYQVW